MSGRLDAVLAALDVGLQDSSESHVYSNVAPTMVDVCVRCQVRDRFDGSDWCGECRAFLLGDGPDPNDDACTVDGRGVGTFVAAFGDLANRICDAVGEVVESARRAGVIGEDGHLTGPCRDVLLAYDVAIFGEAFVDGDGHRVDPATVRQGMRVPEAEWERWRDGSLRDIVPEHVAFDLYGNVVERWRPPPSDPGANLSSCWIPDVG